MVNSETGTTRFEMSQLPQDVAKAVAELQPGEISKPFIMRDSKRDREVVAIVKLTNRVEAHKANLADDFQTIKGMYEQARQEQIVNEWLQKKIRDTYVQIEDGWRGCEFTHSGWVKSK
jgi:peptidyl-prolyl cis-trans isomerase SurA